MGTGSKAILLLYAKNLAWIYGVMIILMQTSCHLQQEAWQKGYGVQKNVRYDISPITYSGIPTTAEDSLRFLGKTVKIDLSKHKINVVFLGEFKDTLAVYINKRKVKQGYFQSTIHMEELLSGKVKQEDNTFSFKLKRSQTACLMYVYNFTQKRCDAINILPSYDEIHISFIDSVWYVAYRDKYFKGV